MSFTHVHAHSTYSLLDGHGQVEAYVKKAAADGHPAIAGTEHGNLYSAPEYEKHCKKHGIKHIPGIEAYMARHSVADRPAKRKLSDGDESSTGKLYYHLILLAQNQTGWQNLMRLSSEAFLQGYYYKPRMDFEMLARHSEGLMATSACLGGIVLQEIMAGNLDAADEVVSRFVDIFGRDRFFIEIQDHGIQEQHDTNPVLLDIAKRFKLRVVATQDCHYADHSHAKSHDSLLCVQTRAKLADTERFRFHGDQHYLKTAAEMRYLFRDVPEACDNTLWVAEQVDPISIIHRDSYHLPHFEVPENFDDDVAYLRHLVLEGAKARYGTITEEIEARIKYELTSFATAGISSYFLIVRDVIAFSRSNGWITGPGRGSAAGCVVSYCLGITQLDPIKYELSFERFYNPARGGLADIDIDVEPAAREPIINYLAEKYGREKVSQIITFFEIQARAAVKDAARVLGYPPFKGDELSKAMPELTFGRPTPLKECLAESPSEKWRDQWTQAADLRALAKDKDNREILDIALGLEGVVRSTGIHAGAVVIADAPLVSYLPLQKLPNSPVTTQFSMNDVEALGLLKLDLLGLRNLSVISDAVQIVKDSKGVEIDPDNVPLDDEATWRLLCAGNSVGLFQIEAGFVREMLRDVRPATLSELAAITAAGRPGPMAMNAHKLLADVKHGRKQPQTLHPDVDHILERTYYQMLYQEQAMAIAGVIAGFTPLEQDKLRKAAAKKIPSEMLEQKTKIIEGAERTGYGLAIGNKFWAMMEPCADYLFCAAHAFAYGYIAYVTAYLKANHPVEYMSALLTSVKDDLDKAGVFLFECESMGIQILPPDVNRSHVEFSPEGDNIRFGLSAIRSIGTEVAEDIIVTRAVRGSFANYDELVKTLPKKTANKKVIHALAAAGALDEFGDRGGILEVVEGTVASVRKEKLAAEQGMRSIFELVEYVQNTEIPEVRLTEKRIRELEREFLGISLTAHPLKGWEETVKRHKTHLVSDLAELEDGTKVTLAGALTAVKPWTTKKGARMATVTLQDFTGSIEALIFSKTWDTISIQLDQVVSISGELSDDGTKLLTREVNILTPDFKTLIKQEKQQVGELKLYLRYDEITDENIEAVRQIFNEPMYAGDAEVVIVLPQEQISLGPDLRIDASKPVMLHKIRKVFGRDVLEC